MTVSSEGKFSTVDDKTRPYAKWSSNTMCVMVAVVPLGTAGREGLEENRV